MVTDDGDNGEETPSTLPTPPPRVALGPDGPVEVSAPTETTPLLQRIPKSFLIIGILVIGVAIAAWLAGRGTTNADDLQAGDCFEMPSGTDIRDVKDQSCDGLHEVEILVVVSLGADAEWPGADPFALGDTPASDACFNAIDPAVIDFENVPDDTIEGHFYPDREGWDGGDHTVLCYAQSEEGFPGPVIIRE